VTSCSCGPPTSSGFNGSVFTLTGAGILTAGAVGFATVDPSGTRAGALRAQSYVMMGLGGRAVVGALFLTFMPSAAERLQESYSVYADDGGYPRRRASTMESELFGAWRGATSRRGASSARRASGSASAWRPSRCGERR
jgi:hypothetical protein